MGIVLASFLWRQTAHLPALQAIDLIDEDFPLEEALESARKNQTLMAGYMPPMQEKLAVHGVLCPSTNPMVLMNSRLIKGMAGTNTHRPLTANWTQRWHCVACGKTIGFPDFATSSHDKFRAISAFHERLDISDFTHAFEACPL